MYHVHTINSMYAEIYSSTVILVFSDGSGWAFWDSLPPTPYFTMDNNKEVGDYITTIDKEDLATFESQYPELFI